MYVLSHHGRLSHRPRYCEEYLSRGVPSVFLITVNADAVRRTPQPHALMRSSGCTDYRYPRIRSPVYSSPPPYSPPRLHTHRRRRRNQVRKNSAESVVTEVASLLATGELDIVSGGENRMDEDILIM